MQFIFSNLLSYDFIIIFFAIINCVIIYLLRQCSNELYDFINPTIYMPIEKIINSNTNDKPINLHIIRSKKEKETKFYNLFISVTNIFPLLGILGTIISLLKMINFSSREVMINFSTALTSTFWGLVFAIIFKGVDGIISSKIETNTEVLNLLFSRLDELNSKE